MSYKEERNEKDEEDAERIRWELNTIRDDLLDELDELHDEFRDEIEEIIDESEISSFSPDEIINALNQFTSSKVTVSSPVRITQAQMDSPRTGLGVATMHTCSILGWSTSMHSSSWG